MTEPKLARIIEVMRDVQSDCESEAMSLDGKPFDGRTVAVQFGNLLAEVKAVARAVEVIAESLAGVSGATPREEGTDE